MSTNPTDSTLPTTNPPPIPSPTQTVPDPILTTYFPLAGLLLPCALAAIPPRKLDLYTLGLASVFTLSGYQLFTVHYSQRRQQQRTQQRTQVVGSTPLGVRARGVDRQGKEGGEEEEGGIAGMAKKLWYGDETAGWQQRRAEEERRKLEEGEGLWGIISERTREAFGGGGGKREDDEEEEEEEEEGDGEE